MATAAPGFQDEEFELDGMGRILVQANSKPPFNVATFLASVDGGRTVSTYRKNKRVFLQGDPADSVFYIQEGSVKVYVVSAQGKEAVVAIHAKGDFFGEGCLTGQPRRLATSAASLPPVAVPRSPAKIPLLCTIPFSKISDHIGVPSGHRLDVRLGVKLGSVPACTARPLYPQEQTSSGRPDMSVSCR